MEVLSCHPHSIIVFLPRWGRVSYIYTTINVHVFSEMSTFITYLCKITLIFECIIYFTLSIWILISCVLSAVSFVCEGKIYDKLTWTSACRLGNIKYVKKIVIRKKKKTYDRVFASQLNNAKSRRAYLPIDSLIIHLPTRACSIIFEIFNWVEALSNKVKKK